MKMTSVRSVVIVVTLAWGLALCKEYLMTQLWSSSIIAAGVQPRQSGVGRRVAQCYIIHNKHGAATSG